MVVERTVGLGGPIERKSAGDVDLERAGFDQPVELGDHLLARLDVVASGARHARPLAPALRRWDGPRDLRRGQPLTPDRPPPRLQ